MFEFTARETIDASPEAVWACLKDIREWWLPSNPEHQSIEFLSGDESIQKGMRIRVREKIAGIPGVAEGIITEFEAGIFATWEADARYRRFGISLAVREGVTWRIEPAGDGEGCELSACVWADFSTTRFGPVVECIFKYLFRGIQRDYEHAMCELTYLKKLIEASKENV